jgi:subtilase family serine protease
MFSFTGSGSDIVFIPLTDVSCVYMFSLTGSGEHIYTAVISEKNNNNIRTTSCKREHTQLSSVRGMITISEPLLVKENIYTQLFSLMTAVYICSLLQEVVLILLSFLLLMTAVCVLFYRKWF